LRASLALQETAASTGIDTHMAATSNALKIFFTIAGLLSSAYAYTEYKAYPARQYCSELAHGASFSDASELASLRGLVGDLGTPVENGRLMVFNHLAPHWRFACVVTFTNGTVSATEFRAAD